MGFSDSARLSGTVIEVSVGSGGWVSSGAVDDSFFEHPEPIAMQKATVSQMIDFDLKVILSTSIGVAYESAVTPSRAQPTNPESLDLFSRSQQ